MPDMDDDVTLLRSLRCERFALLTFVVKCRRNVDVFWRDYAGRRVKYATLRPGAHFDMNTFETHPWEFRDADTNDVLEAYDGVAVRSEVYFPRAWRGDITYVHIDIPVYKLRQRCIQRVRDLYTSDVIKTLELPPLLCAELLHNPPVQYDTLMHVQPEIL